MSKYLKIIPLAVSLLVLSSCAKVGSDRWCANMKEKPKGEWTMEDATNFTKHCIKF